MNIEKIYSDIQQNGFSVVENFLEDVAAVKNEVIEMLDNVEDDSSYKFGKAYRLPVERETFINNPNVHEVFSQEWMHELAKKYLNNQDLYSEIFVSNEYRNNQGLEANGYLHFDKFHTFKYMLYLTDSDQSSGAFSCIPDTHIDGKFLRQSAWKETNVHRDIKNKPLYDYRDGCGYTEKDIISVAGKAGTLIVFDTDLFHFGGRVEDNKERLMIRLHFHDGSRWTQ
jgi:ectoine hydroxylase-related dioxygenase (phytanoyl-CoA dioxygenase family)|tara:strand:- start:2369 stop:3046 length:678 start_codon:yes stop_codon:yes gene_type:complete